MLRNQKAGFLFAQLLYIEAYYTPYKPHKLSPYRTYRIYHTYHSHLSIPYPLPPPKHKTQKSLQESLPEGSRNEKKAATYSPALHCSTIGASGLNFSV
ncbi:MAG: hypothetical protein PUK67_06590, partial [Prevotellaceae bacterium]|nr:hypothetical protein [Prevotellaceae bacterium]MDY3364752.1 hypothetical protein [Prevotella sp.]